MIEEDYTKVIEYLENSKPQGKIVYSVGGRWFEVDYNFDPPRVTEIKEEE